MKALCIGAAFPIVLSVQAAPLEPSLAKGWQAEVAAAECAFAASMAQRDFAAFEQRVSEQAIFFGAADPLLGKSAVLAGWKTYFEAQLAPFSWAPDEVVVSPDGSLAHSSGLVRDPKGGLLMRFNSVWRQESPGVWRVVVDRASPLTAADRSAASKPSATGC
ncbi:nuclear transport factor 2 family protein [Paucibacter sp. B2R-40]|uniref:YybH family protein n=1 Tax=Paucibacter sp. B2R-40 TaxID=2893554 RepID=UPI0021E3B107|nr:nuclear transport factor 2 family protein [Paucibacter sp. B2R-40]MCV2355590.1 nuclear transport factor 2 family protein [Paucibacter sp. B2R-40]